MIDSSTEVKHCFHPDKEIAKCKTVRLAVWNGNGKDYLYKTLTF